MENCAYPRRVGDDSILRNGEQLVVCSKADMDEWEVREKRKTVIYINNEAWHVVGKQFYAKDEVRYLLDPCLDVTREIPGRIIRYNDEYVRARDEAEKKRRMESWTYPVFYLLTPLIGFLPSCVKAKIESNYGVSARNATLISIFIELLLFFASVGLFVLITATAADQSSGGFIYVAVVNSLIHEIVLFLILLIDIAMRYGSYLRDDISPWGAFEWVWSWIRRKKQDS